MLIILERWIELMEQEMTSIERNNTWNLVKLSEGKKTIGVKWAYKTKLNARGKVERCKACIVAKGYKQK